MNNEFVGNTSPKDNIDGISFVCYNSMEYDRKEGFVFE